MSFPRYPKYKDSGVEWLGQVPEHWGVGQSRRLFALRNERAQEGDKQLTASQEHGVIYQEDFVRLEGRRVVEVIKGAEILKHVEPNDFVISMRSFQGGIEWCNLRGSISSAYVMLVPGERAHGPFFGHLFKSSGYIQALQTTSNLVRDGQALRYENFTKVDLPLVPLDEQARIAAFLDQELAKIDRLVAEQRRLMELLKEKRQAVVSRAVTKGLNPDAPMKPSGIEWLGDVPEHWTRSKPKYFTTKIVDGVHFKPTYVDEGVPFVTVRNLTAGPGISFEHLNYITEEDHQEYFKRANPEKGDVLLTKDGTLGVARVVETDRVFSIFVSVALLKPIKEMIDPWFLCYALESDVAFQQFKAGELGSALKHIHLVHLRGVTIAVPPLEEQKEIVRSLDKEINQLEALVAEAQRAIALLEERRAALISAAVTGQIDVRGLVEAA